MSEAFSGIKGKFVKLEESISGFKALLDGAGDDYPEAAFFMTGTIDEAIKAGEKIVQTKSD